MRELPGGTVTFLFTDIEGSTRLLHELGAGRYAEALTEHRRVLRDAFERHGGVEVDTQGDSFFVAFGTAPGALDAAREAQDGLELPVRMGLHTGTPLLTEEGYVGADIHRAARIAAAGHGRQVLVSAATAALVDGAELRDLGHHRLKDLSAPERIFQLGDGEFPALKTLHRTNLPIPATPFLGREHELGAVRKLLARDDVRLLTLTGAGGSGKTRLALQATGELGDAYPDGVWWVPLAPITDAADVGPAAARAFGGGGSLPEIIGARRLLLLLDNFEHVLEAAPEVAGLLAECPHADVLVTSRERLRLQGENVYPVPVLERAEARRLFVARARAAQPDFEADDHLDELCERLDDLPLALELAAARTSLLSTEQLVERLGDRLDFLRGGRDSETRQQTLRATIEWSYELLEPDERTLLAGLSVFRGGWTLEAAEEVAGADLAVLESLVDKSLARRAGQRFWMLETIREFAAERLAESGDEDGVLERLAVHMLELGESARLSAESDPPVRPELVRPDLDNFHRAIDWAIDHDPELAFRLGVSLELFWALNDAIDGARRLRSIFGTGATMPPELHARALRVLGAVTWMAGELDEGTRIMKQSLAAFEALGDELGVAVLRHRLAIPTLLDGDLDGARAFLQSSLETSRRFSDHKLEGDVLRALAIVERSAGHTNEALELCEQSIEILERVGDAWVLTHVLQDSAELLHELGETSRAVERTRDALRLSHELVDRRAMVFSIAQLAAFATAMGSLERAGRLWGAAEAETARAPVGLWEANRDELEAQIVRDDPAFERGREVGSRLSLEEAVAYALGP